MPNKYYPTFSSVPMVETGSRFASMQPGQTFIAVQIPFQMGCIGKWFKQTPSCQKCRSNLNYVKKSLPLKNPLILYRVRWNPSIYFITNHLNNFVNPIAARFWINFPWFPCSLIFWRSLWNVILKYTFCFVACGLQFEVYNFNLALCIHCISDFFSRL